MPSIVSRSANSSGDQSKSTYCLSQLSVTFILELPQKPQIVCVKQADIVDSIANHCDSFDPESEGPARPHLGIVADIFKHLWMDHSAPGDLEPFLAHFSRQRTAEINFEARFGVAEIMRTETNFCFWSHQLLEDKFHCSLQIADRHISIDVKSL